MAIITFTNQQRFDFLVTALEGGSNYWYWIPNKAIKIAEDTPVKEPFEDSDTTCGLIWNAIKEGKSIPIHDKENPKDKLGEISLKSIEEGEQLMADKHPYHFANLVNENYDAETADVWFQLAVMKEVVYG